VLPKLRGATRGILTGMKPVYRARDVTEAHLIVAYLQSYDIAAAVDGEALGALSGGVPFRALAPRVWVDDADAERARELITKRPRSADDLEACIHCGYNLTGLPEPRCPECGEPFRPPRTPTEPLWTCPGCGEEIEAQFTACWNCGAERPAPPPAKN
jgi:hypothetical protein